MADVKKQEKDFTKEVDQLIPEATSVAQVSFCRTVEPRICPLMKDWAHWLDCSSHSQESFRRVWTSCFRLRSKLEMYASVFLDVDIHWIGALIPNGVGFGLVLYNKTGQNHLSTNLRCSRLRFTQFEY